jgi:hypothetical protein
MLDLENVPADVTKIALTCLLHGITFQRIMEKSAEHNAVVAAEAGLSFDQYLGAVRWVCTYLETHDPSGLPAN